MSNNIIKFMKLRITLSDEYAQKLLQDLTFHSLFEYVYDGQDRIKEIWIENTVINNDESTFKIQVLDLIKQHYCRIFDVKAEHFDFVYNNTERGNMPTSLILKKEGKFFSVATIVEYISD